MKIYAIYAAVVMAILFLASSVHDYVFEQGRKAERADIQVETNKQLELYQKQQKEQADKALSDLAADHAAEIERMRGDKKTTVITKEIIRYVEKEIHVPGECADLAISVVSVLKQATDVIHSAARAGKSGDISRAAGILPSSAAADRSGIKTSTDSNSRECSNNSRLLQTAGQLSRCGKAP